MSELIKELTNFNNDIVFGENKKIRCANINGRVYFVLRDLLDVFNINEGTSKFSKRLIKNGDEVSIKKFNDGIQSRCFTIVAINGINYILKECKSAKDSTKIANYINHEIVPSLLRNGKNEYSEINTLKEKLKREELIHDSLSKRIEYLENKNDILNYKAELFDKMLKNKMLKTIDETAKLIGVQSEYLHNYINSSFIDVCNNYPFKQYKQLFEKIDNELFITPIGIATFDLLCGK